MTNVDFDVELQKFSEFLALPESFEKVKEGKGADILFKILIFFSHCLCYLNSIQEE